MALDRFNDFVAAQDRVYDAVCRELTAGEKRTHWMWFVFPQLAGLGSSAMAQKFAIRSLDEARLYLAHPVLGERLRECTRLVLAVPDRGVDDIFGYPDNLKFHSSMTLFAAAAPGEPLFAEALDRFFGGQPDEQTLKLLGP
jgi:uncharacterized protein (DUF1810 family)